MSKWSKEDKNIFNNSEVMLEMEKNVVENIFKYASIIKEGQDADAANRKMQEPIKKTSKYEKICTKSQQKNLQKPVRH